VPAKFNLRNGSCLNPAMKINISCLLVKHKFRERHLFVMPSIRDFATFLQKFDLSPTTFLRPPRKVAA
jgi:hypothetical protein